MADAFGETMAMLLFVTLLTGSGIYYIDHLKRRNNKLEQTVSNYQDAERMSIVISSKIQDLAELTTVREEFTAEISHKDNKAWHGFKIPFTDVNFRMIYSGVISCGCDLTRVRVPRTSISGNSATIIIPQCTVLDIHSKPGSCKIISNEKGFLADAITLEMQDKLVTADLEREQNLLISEGILQRANENVCRILKAHMQAIGINPHVVFLNGNSDISRIAAADTRLLN